MLNDGSRGPVISKVSENVHGAVLPGFLIYIDLTGFNSFRKDNYDCSLPP